MSEFRHEPGDIVFDIKSPHFHEITVRYEAEDGAERPILSDGRTWIYVDNARLIGPPHRVKQQRLIAAGKQ